MRRSEGVSGQPDCITQALVDFAAANRIRPTRTVLGQGGVIRRAGLKPKRDNEIGHPGHVGGKLPLGPDHVQRLQSARPSACRLGGFVGPARYGSVVSGLPDLRESVRDEVLPRDATVIIRGGPDTAEKLATHAERVRRAFVLDGEPVLGISVFAVLDDIGPASIDGILAGKLATYRVVYLPWLQDLVDGGFAVLPTFGRPHLTVVLSGLDRVEPLLQALGPARDNPHYGEMVRRRRG